MAIDIVKGSHNVAFPSKVQSALGGGHEFNIELSANHDNGTLVARGEMVSFDLYAEVAVGGTNDFAGKIVWPDVAIKDQWYVEVTADTDLLFVYNSPVSEYPQRELQDESLFYIKAGDPARAYSLHKGDIVSLSKSAFNGTPVKGKTLTYANGKYVVGA